MHSTTSSSCSCLSYSLSRSNWSVSQLFRSPQSSSVLLVHLVNKRKAVCLWEVTRVLLWGHHLLGDVLELGDDLVQIQIDVRCRKYQLWILLEEILHPKSWFLFLNSLIFNGSRGGDQCLLEGWCDWLLRLRWSESQPRLKTNRYVLLPMA